MLILYKGELTCQCERDQIKAMTAAGWSLKKAAPKPQTPVPNVAKKEVVKPKAPKPPRAAQPSANRKKVANE